MIVIEFDSHNYNYMFFEKKILKQFVDYRLCRNDNQMTDIAHVVFVRSCTGKKSRVGKRKKCEKKFLFLELGGGYSL